MPDTKTIAVVVFLTGFGVGAACFSWIGKLYTQKVEQEFTEYQQNQKEAFLRAKDEAQTQQEESNHAYRQKETELQAEMVKNAVLNRALSAGRLRLATCSSGDPVQPAQRINEARTDTVSASGSITTESATQVINDCAVTTLMLNNLQADIEKQLAKAKKTP